jgi:hypothetical protein
MALGEVVQALWWSGDGNLMLTRIPLSSESDKDNIILTELYLKIEAVSSLESMNSAVNAYPTYGRVA